MYIDHTKLPQFTIDCRSLDNAIDLKRLLSEFTRGTYEIYVIYKGQRETGKFGATADPEGERVYRQIWRFPGWPTEPGPISAGEDIDDTVELLLQKYPGLTKDNVYVHIWDMSQLPALNRLCPDFEPKWLEGQFILAHAESRGHCPIGNKQEQRRLERGLIPRIVKTVPVDAVLDRLFYSEG
jgi:hypothetical protein